MRKRNQAVMPHEVRPDDILLFWRAAGPGRWFRKDPVFDAELRSRFEPAHEAAARGELDWSHSADGSLALLILLDQFPRNAYRDTPRMYATDAQAREVARHAIAEGFDCLTAAELRNFFYLPFMHSEDPADQQRCIELTAALGGESERYALHHHDIIARFGRFPHRNALLGRKSTRAEQLFLDQGGFSG